MPNPNFPLIHSAQTLPHCLIGTSAKEVGGGVDMAKTTSGGTAEYLNDTDENSSAGKPSPLPPPVSSKARMGDPPPKVKLNLRPPKPPPPPPPAAPTPAPAPKKEKKEEKKEKAEPAPAAAGQKRAYQHTADYYINKEAKRAQKQMKELSTGTNAPRYDIQKDVQQLPSEKGGAKLSNLFSNCLCCVCV